MFRWHRLSDFLLKNLQYVNLLLPVFDKIIVGDLVFGYVKVDKIELKIGDYEVYKGAYCSLCKEMGRSFGLLSRLTLSYDFAFLALLKMSVGNNCPQFKKSRCSFNPLHKCNCCEKDNESVEFSAYIAMIMLYYKVKDNIEDCGFLKRFLMYLILPIVVLYHNKAKKKYPQLDEIVANSMLHQSQLEKENCANIDVAANPTATALGEIFSFGEQDEQQSRVLKHLGYCIGRYVYIMDAIDDLQYDLNHGGYNTFVISKKLSIGDDITNVKLEASEIINRTISEIINTYELLKLVRFENIFDNVIYNGLNKEKKRILNKEVI